MAWAPLALLGLDFEALIRNSGVVHVPGEEQVLRAGEERRLAESCGGTGYRQHCRGVRHRCFLLSGARNPLTPNLSCFFLSDRSTLQFNNIVLQ